MRRWGVVFALMMGGVSWGGYALAANGSALPEWVRLSDDAKRYTEAHPHSAAGSDRFVSLDIDVSYPNYKVIQRIQRVGQYAEVARRDGYGEQEIENPVDQKRILQAFHGFLSTDDEHQLGDVRYEQDASFPRGGFRITTETIIPDAPTGRLRFHRDCAFVRSEKARTLVSGLPGEIFNFRCDSQIEGAETQPPVLHFYYSDYLDMVVNRYYDHSTKDDLTNMENDRTLTFRDEAGAQRTSRYSNFPR